MADNNIRDFISPELYEHLDVVKDQIWYFRTHLDVFLCDYFGVKLKDTQRVIAREVGNSWDVTIAMNRGYGKTWLLAWCVIGLCVLWPDTPVAVVSNTALQANLLLKKIVDDILPNYPDVVREIDYGTGRFPRINEKSNNTIYLKNGSRIMSFVLGHKGNSALGQRAKIIIVDEAKLIQNAITGKVLRPIRSYKRPVFYELENNGFVDYRSKVINISSAYFNTCDYAKRFMGTLMRMARGTPGSFACALNWESCVRVGIETREYYEEEMQEQTPIDFAMEYGTIFVGAASGSVFPYTLTEPCRTLQAIELSQPKGTTCNYVIAVDVAGSFDGASEDNSSIAVLKIVEKSENKWQKHLVWMGAYKGITQRDLAIEVRKTFLRFPNTIMIIYDRNALGIGMMNLFDEPWQYEDEKGTKREMPPLVSYDANVRYKCHNILYPFVANNTLNNDMAKIMMKNLEDKDFRMPVISASVEHSTTVSRIIDDDSDDETSKKQKRRITMMLKQEVDVYKETDALQAEMGNIVCKFTAEGNPRYVPAISTQKKDRYITVAMGLWYIDQIEAKSRRSNYKGKKKEIPAVVGSFWKGGRL